MSSTQYGMIVAFFQFGMMLGEFPMGMLMDRWGAASRLHLRHRVVVDRQRHARPGELGDAVRRPALLAGDRRVRQLVRLHQSSRRMVPTQRARARRGRSSTAEPWWARSSRRRWWSGWSPVRLAVAFVVPSVLGVRLGSALAQNLSPNPKGFGPIGEARPRIAQLLRLRQTWAVILCRTLAGPVMHLYVYWLPLYLFKPARLQPDADRTVRLGAVSVRRSSAASAAAGSPDG